MSNCGKLYNRNIDYFNSKILVKIGLLGVNARDELLSVTRESRSSCLILKNHSKNEPGTQLAHFLCTKSQSYSIFLVSYYLSF